MKDENHVGNGDVSLDEMGRILRTDRLSTTIKVEPKDFVVREVVECRGEPMVLKPFFANDLRCVDRLSGMFSILDMTKVDIESGRAIKIIADHCKVSVQYISAYGKKDARAQTVQRICVPTEVMSKLLSFDHDNIFLSWVGTARQSLRIGGHLGNYFEIITHNNSVGCTVDIDTPRVHREGFMNYFGPQRFGGGSGYEIGQALVEGRNEQAFNLMKKNFFYKDLSIVQQSSDLFTCFKNAEFRSNVRFSLQQFQSYLFNALISHLTLSGKVSQEQHLWTPARTSEYSDVWNGPQKLDKGLKGLLPVRGRPRATRVFPKDLAYKKLCGGYKFVFQLPPGAFATQLLSEFFDLHQGPHHRKVA